MIDLTPLDVRKKRGDFKKSMRGYEPQEVDTFLDLVAERMEELVKETIGLRERSERLQVQVDAQSGRERAVQDALVTAQALREDMREQALRDTELARREAELEAKKVLAEAEARLEERRGALEEVERKRSRFLKSFRALLERELDMVVVEEGRSPLDDRPVDLVLSGGPRPRGREGGEAAEREGDVLKGGPAERIEEAGPAAIAENEADEKLDAPRGHDAPQSPGEGELWLSGLSDAGSAARPED